MVRGLKGRLDRMNSPGMIITGFQPFGSSSWQHPGRLAWAYIVYAVGAVCRWGSPLTRQTGLHQPKTDFPIPICGNLRPLRITPPLPHLPIAGARRQQYRSTAATPQELSLVDHRTPQLNGLLQLGSGILPCHHTGCFLAHAARHFSTARLNPGGGIIPLQSGQRAGQHERLPPKMPGTASDITKPDDSHPFRRKKITQNPDHRMLTTLPKSGRMRGSRLPR